MQRARLFGSHLTHRQRRVYGAVIAFYAMAVLAGTWPVYTLFGGERPLILGLPLSLFWTACWVIGSFLVLLALFLWENGGRWEGRGDEEADPGGWESAADRGTGD